MTDRDLMQQALEVAETAEADLEEALAMYIARYGENHRPLRLQALRDDLAKCVDTIAALRERLAQPEQEPVAHLWQHSETGRTRIVMPDQIITTDATWHVVGPLHLGTPPRREWVGLTDEEIKRMAAKWFLSMYWPICNTFAREIEAKLREKNGGAA